jgi:hypothetical protein
MGCPRSCFYLCNTQSLQCTIYAFVSGAKGTIRYIFHEYTLLAVAVIANDNCYIRSSSDSTATLQGNVLLCSMCSTSPAETQLHLASLGLVLQCLLQAASTCPRRTATSKDRRCACPHSPSTTAGCPGQRSPTGKRPQRALTLPNTCPASSASSASMHALSAMTLPHHDECG